MDAREPISGGGFVASDGTTGFAPKDLYTFYSETPLKDSAEIFDPATGRFTATGSMNTPRMYHRAVLLNNGKVLISGGWNGTSGGGQLATSEVFDPGSGTFTATGNMSNARAQHTGTPTQ